MPRRRLTAEEHVVRHCSNSKLMKRNGQVVGVFGEAFRLRSAEKYLSSTWFEYFTGSRQDRFVATIAALRGMPREIKKKDGLVILSVNRLEACGTARAVKIKCWHEPKPNNRAYAAIRGLPLEQDSDLMDLIAEEVAAADIAIVQDLEG
jgi:hypothetical protein